MNYLAGKAMEIIMKKQDYIDAVLAQITSKALKRKIESELQGHIDDRISFYKDAGYDDKTSQQKAMENMGNPEEVGREFSELHKSKGCYPYVLSIMIAVYGVLIFCAKYVYLFILLITQEPSLSPGFMVLELIFVTFVLLYLYLAKRYNSVFLSISTLIGSVAYFVFIASDLYVSDIMTGACSIVSGRYSNFEDLLLNYTAFVTDVRVKIISLIAVGFLVVINILVIRDIIRFKKNINTLKDGKIITLISKAIIIILVLTVFLFVVLFVPVFDVSKNSSEYNYPDGVIVVESDTKNLKGNLEFDERNFLEINYEFFDENYAETNSKKFSEYDYIIRREAYDKYADYKTETLFGKFRSSKKYVAVIPVYDYYEGEDFLIDSYEIKWYSTDNNPEIKGEFYNNTMLYEIDVEK